MSQKANKTTPTVIAGVLYTDDDFTGAVLDSPEWQLFLAAGRSFSYDGLTCRCETRRHGVFWYSYRKIAGRTVKRYIGKPADVTAARLADVAETMHGQKACSGRR